MRGSVGDESYMPRALRPLTAALVLAIAAVGVVLVGFPLRMNLWSYAFATEAGSIVFIGAATALLLVWPGASRQADAAVTRAGIVLVSGVAIVLCLWSLPGPARVHCGILTAVWLCSAASVWTDTGGPVVR
jgi:hypothetical protein